ncbi:MAG: GNAT family N-acetyltransferase [Candidatus Binatia bacterium]
MHVRLATPEDAPQIVRIFHDTVHKVNSRNYTPEQVNAWAPQVPDPEEWATRKLQTRITFVADNNEILAGFGELEENGHIDCLYCHHAHQRQGVGSALYARIEEHARAMGLPCLFAEVSITARPFFQTKGFSLVRRQTVVRRGVELTNFLMEKELPVA